MLLVDPALSRIGVGTDTFNAAIGHAAGRTVAVDAPSGLQERLREMGFKPAWTIIRFAGRIPPARASTDPHVIAATEQHQRANGGAGCRMLPRRPAGFRQGLCHRSGAAHLVYANANGRIYGYGVLRPARDALRIGPLYAQESTTPPRSLTACAIWPAGPTGSPSDLTYPGRMWRPAPWPRPAD